MQQMSLAPELSKHAEASHPDASVAFELAGSVERVVYFNEETGQCVLDIKPFHLKLHVLITGMVPTVYPGQSIQAVLLNLSSEQIRFLSSDNEGLKELEGLLHADKMEIKRPHSSRTLKKFLKSGALSEVGPHLASTLAKTFPENLFSILEDCPGQLLDVPGIGRKRQVQILQSWNEFKARTEFENYLFEQRLPLNWSKLIWPFHRIESLRFLKTKPYLAVSQHNLDFEIMDSYALKEGFSVLSEERVRSGLYDILQNYYKQGHCAFPEGKLLEEAREKLNVPDEAIENALELELIAENLVIDSIGGTNCVYLKEIWQLEKDVALKLLNFQTKQPPWGWFNMQKVLDWAQTLLNIHLAPLQKQAIETALSSSLTVITGGPGTGKTTLIRSLVTILQTQFAKFALCSPTGRAAQRLEEATNVPAKTIHRLLKMKSDGTFTYHQGNPLDLDLVLIDEASMVDLSLMSNLLDALPVQCALILVGDSDQIPPVGAGNILQSVIASNRFSVVRLTDIYRQSEKSLIKINSHRINSGKMPLTLSDAKTDFHYIPVDGVEETKRTIIDLVTRVIPQECGITDPSQFQILTPLNRGPLGTQQLNEDLQQYISVEFPEASQEASPFESENEDPGLESVGGFGQTFKRGDKVMVVKNDYGKDVFNGDIGFIYRIDRYGQFIDVQFEQRNVRFGLDELDRLTLAYAISIHKSQGSEYKAVIVVISGEHLPMAQRHLIYTAVTRGKEHVFLVAEPYALQTAILSDENNRRWQKLTERLQAH
jgi:exodeoxyribonuclease V alpha subunit